MKIFPLYTTQLDILGFTSTYRIIFMLAVGMFLITFILLPVLKYLIRHQCNALLHFLLMLGMLSFMLLLYDSYRKVDLLQTIWLKTVIIYSSAYAIILFLKGIRQRNKQKIKPL